MSDPVTVPYRFKLTASGVASLDTGAVCLMQAQSCGVTSGLLSSVIASGAMNNRQLERVLLVLRLRGHATRSALFLQSAP